MLAVQLSHMIYPVAHLRTLKSSAVPVTVARTTTRYHCAEHKHSADAALTSRVRYRRGGTLRYFPRPALSMPTYPCSTTGCGGWTHRRAGKWHHLPADFALQLDEARLAVHRRICQRCWNRHSNHTLSLDGRIRSRSRKPQPAVHRPAHRAAVGRGRRSTAPVSTCRCTSSTYTCNVPFPSTILISHEQRLACPSSDCCCCCTCHSCRILLVAPQSLE